MLYPIEKGWAVTDDMTISGYEVPKGFVVSRRWLTPSMVRGEIILEWLHHTGHLPHKRMCWIYYRVLLADGCKWAMWYYWRALITLKL